jgi:hypothetical protein
MCEKGDGKDASGTPIAPTCDMTNYTKAGVGTDAFTKSRIKDHTIGLYEPSLEIAALNCMIQSARECF